MNILVITNYNYEYSGGIENYNKLLYTTFPEHNFFELCLMNNGEISKKIKNVKSHFISNNLFDYKKVKCKNNIFLFIKKIFNIKKEIFFLYRKISNFVDCKNIDLIIFSGQLWYHKKFIKKNIDKCLFLQHSHIKHYIDNFWYNSSNYCYEERKKTIISKFIDLLLCKDNFFKVVKYIVTVEKYSTKILKSFYKDKICFEIPVPSKFENYEKTIFRKSFFFISPIRNSFEKNPDKIIDIAEKLKFKTLLIGNGHEKMTTKYVIKNNDVNTSLLFSLYNQSKFLLLSSFFEGFSLVSSESLSLGLPIIVPNTHLSAKYLVGENERGFIYNLCDSTEKICKSIKEYIDTIDYKKVSTECIRFYNENISNKVFMQKWKDIFTYFRKNNL